MSERIGQIAVATVAGTILPVGLVVAWGLMNEGFSSIGFLLYPGAETWLQLALISACVVLLLRGVPSLRQMAAEPVSTSAVAAAFLSLLLATFALILVGLGETPIRKYYTYVVAPRAVSALLGLAIIALAMIQRTHPAKHAAQQGVEPDVE